MVTRGQHQPKVGETGTSGVNQLVGEQGGQRREPQAGMVKEGGQRREPKAGVKEGDQRREPTDR